MMHAATKIMQNRADQLGLDDDELMHYGRKGMKWNETIFTDEDRARGQAVRAAQKQQRETDAIRAQGQAVREAQRKQRETDAIRAQGQAVREAQRKQRGTDAIRAQGQAVREAQRQQRESGSSQNKDDLNEKKKELLKKVKAERDARNQGYDTYASMIDENLRYGNKTPYEQIRRHDSGPEYDEAVKPIREGKTDKVEIAPASDEIKKMYIDAGYDPDTINKYLNLEASTDDMKGYQNLKKEYSPYIAQKGKVNYQSNKIKNYGKS